MKTRFIKALSMAAIAIFIGVGVAYMDVTLHPGEDFSGHDTLNLGTGSDTLNFQGGWDNILFEAGRDKIDFGDGDDTLQMGDGTDVVKMGGDPSDGISLVPSSGSFGGAFVRHPIYGVLDIAGSHVNINSNFDNGGQVKVTSGTGGDVVIQLGGGENMAPFN